MSALQDEIRAVLATAQRGKPNAKVRGLLTSYQILGLLPKVTRDDLVKKHGAPGKNAGVHYTAASAVATALGGMTDVDVDYLDTRTLGIAAGDTEAGNPLCGVYRLKQYGPSTW
jgi:hypothetical protein